MIYLLWGLLNIGLGILFIYLLFKATKLINESSGNFSRQFLLVRQ